MENFLSVPLLCSLKSACSHTVSPFQVGIREVGSSHFLPGNKIECEAAERGHECRSQKRRVGLNEQGHSVAHPRPGENRSDDGAFVRGAADVAPAHEPAGAAGVVQAMEGLGKRGGFQPVQFVSGQGRRFAHFRVQFWIGREACGVARRKQRVFHRKPRRRMARGVHPVLEDALGFGGILGNPRLAQTARHLGKACEHFALRHPVARRGAQRGIGLLFRPKIARPVFPAAAAIGRPPVVKLVDHLRLVQWQFTHFCLSLGNF